MQPLGVIGKKAGLFMVLLGKVFCGYLKRFLYPFADGNAGHHNDELAPAELLVHLKNRFNVAVGFTRTCFHLHIDV